MWYLQKVDQTMLDEYSQDIATVAHAQNLDIMPCTMEDQVLLMDIGK